MATIDVVNIEGKKVGAIELADEVFGAEVKEHLLWEVVKAQQAAKRAGTHVDQDAAARCAAAARSPTSRRAPATRARARSRAPQLRRRRQGLRRRTRATTRTRVPKKVTRAARCARRCRCARKEKKLVVVDELRARRDQDQAPGRHPQGARASRRRWSSTARSNEKLVEVGAQPAQVEVPRARGAQRLRRPRPRDAGASPPTPSSARGARHRAAKAKAR